MQNTQEKDGDRFGTRVLLHLNRFRREEEGSMIIFAMFIFITMLIVAGIAVDLMRFETNRSRLQATLDRAVLASSALDQTLDPEAVAGLFSSDDLGCCCDWCSATTTLARRGFGLRMRGYFC